MISADLQPGDVLLSATYWDPRIGRSAEMVVERRSADGQGWIIVNHGQLWDRAIDKGFASGMLQWYRP